VHQHGSNGPQIPSGGPDRTGGKQAYSSGESIHMSGLNFGALWPKAHWSRKFTFADGLGYTYMLYRYVICIFLFYVFWCCLHTHPVLLRSSIHQVQLQLDALALVDPNQDGLDKSAQAHACALSTVRDFPRPPKFTRLRSFPKGLKQERKALHSQGLDLLA
jgi:hypothetical protein